MTNHKNAKRSREASGSLTRQGPSPLRFVLWFLAWLVVLGGLYAFAVVRYRAAVGFFTGLIASVSGGLAHLLPGSVTVSRNLITYDGFTVTVIDECTGLLEVLIFAAAVLAVSVSWKKKLWGLVYGVPLICLFNILRITVLLVAGTHSAALYNFLHLYLWQATIIVLIAALWWSWLRLAVRHE